MYGVPSFLGFFQWYCGTRGIKEKGQERQSIDFGQPFEPLNSAAWLISGVQGPKKLRHLNKEAKNTTCEMHNACFSECFFFSLCLSISRYYYYFNASNE